MGMGCYRQTGGTGNNEQGNNSQVVVMRLTESILQGKAPWVILQVSANPESSVTCENHMMHDIP